MFSSEHEFFRALPPTVLWFGMAGPLPEPDLLFSQDTIAARVKELGAQISQDFAEQPLVAVSILKGAFMFFADLVRHIDLPLSCDFLATSSYGDETKSSGVVQLTQDLSRSIRGKNVLLVEDIIDSGLTMRYLLDTLLVRGPQRVKVCTLLQKPSNHQTKVQQDYVGFEIPDKFVVGYGLDYAGNYRHLPYIGTINIEL